LTPPHGHQLVGEFVRQTHRAHFAGDGERAIGGALDRDGDAPWLQPVATSGKSDRLKTEPLDGAFALL
jgi:hypothetical protein